MPVSPEAWTTATIADDTKAIVAGVLTGAAEIPRPAGRQDAHIAARAQSATPLGFGTSNRSIGDLHPLDNHRPEGSGPRGSTGEPLEVAPFQGHCIITSRNPNEVNA